MSEIDERLPVSTLKVGSDPTSRASPYFDLD